MSTAPFSTRHFTSTTAPDRPLSDRDQLPVYAARRGLAVGERALVLGGGGSAGNAWLIGVIAGLLDAGLDVTEADLMIGTSAGSTVAAQISGASPAGLYAAILACAPPPCPPPPHRVQVPTAAGPRRCRRRTFWRRRAASSPPPRTWPTCAAGWVRRRWNWMWPRTVRGTRGGAPSSPLGCPARTGRSGRCSSSPSTPTPVNRSCSTATAGSTWWTPSPPAWPAPAALPTGSATATTSTVATGATRTPIW